MKEKMSRCVVEPFKKDLECSKNSITVVHNEIIKIIKNYLPNEKLSTKNIINAVIDSHRINEFDYYKVQYCSKIDAYEIILNGEWLVTIGFKEFGDMVFIDCFYESQEYLLGRIKKSNINGKK